ncbi:MAG: MFS transporter [Burkholderiaceae bacterium]
MTGVIPKRTVFWLGITQLVSWGITYYLVGGFGELIAADLHWSEDVVYGGFSVALLVMGLFSPLAGRLVDRYGGRPVMAWGSVINAAGCAFIASSTSIPGYFMAWVVLGIGMRLTLYDAAFAALARLGGPNARRPMAQITLLGGLASTLFWPLGHTLALEMGWRGAVWTYALLALLVAPAHLAISGERYLAPALPVDEIESSPTVLGRSDTLLAAGAYTLITALTNFLNAGMSAHMIAILIGLGASAASAVGISSLRGVGQSAARFGEILFGRRMSPLTLNVWACGLLPIAFASGFYGGRFAGAASLFALAYGIGNGIATITRGTMALVLFDHRTYGIFVGRLLAPSFVLSAIAPLIYAIVIGHFGETGALLLSLGVSLVALGAALELKRRVGEHTRSAAAKGATSDPRASPP